jgi:rRNA maturation endonuclease Nob1
LAKKGLTVWIFSTLTFIATIHLVEAIAVFAFNNPIRLLQMYPIINEKVQSITPDVYLLVTTIATVSLWGITCATAFDNPVETFLNQIISEAKKQSNIETQSVESKSEMLDSMYETIESNNETIAQIKDLIYNVRTEVKEIHPLGDNLEKIKTELNTIKKEVKRLEEKTNYPNICLSCGKPLLPEFKICPYCGENIKLQTTPILTVKDYK